MLRIAIVIGSTRPGRIGEAVGHWAYNLAQQRGDAEYELVDLAAWDLPLLDEPAPPMMRQYSKPHTKRWSEKVASLDGFLFVTAEYNHNVPAALKNAIDFLYHEWNNKAAGFVAYGSMMGARAVEALRLVMAELQVATVREQVGLSLFADFEDYTRFKPHPRHEKSLHGVLDQLVPWCAALKLVREGKVGGATQEAGATRAAHGEHSRPPRPKHEDDGHRQRERGQDKPATQQA